MNHEYHDDGLLFVDGTANWSAAKVAKSMASEGVSVIEVKFEDGQLARRTASRFGRGLRQRRPARSAALRPAPT
jgi:secreted PhoX family phosphatase